MTDELTAVASLGSTVAEEAATYGIEINPICKALGINPETFDDITARISLDRLCRLLEACAVLSHNEAFGLGCAARFVPGATGPFGYGLMAAPTGRDFIAFLAANIRYATHTSYFRLTFEEKFARLSWTFAPLIVRRDQYVDMSVSLVLLRLADIGIPTGQIELDLERPRPRDPAVFREFLTRRLSFECAINELRIPNALLAQVNPNGDVRMFQMMDMQCQALQPDLTVEGGELFEQVKHYLMLRVADPDISLTAIANYFRISERTLQRRLAEHETTLQALRDDVRRRVSFQLLTESDLRISEIGYRLGYSAPSAFTRSVSRWFGATPRQLRGAQPAD
nr:AraC family transcriptional regulator [Rhizobium halophytocola]